MIRKAIIFGLRGTTLTTEERHLLKTEKPWGVILFSRNIKNLFQLEKLIIDIKNCVKDKNYPILIDQEGGRVSRLNKIIDLSIFSQGLFGNFYKNDKKKFYNYYKIYIDTVSEIIKKVGININTVPVMDVRRKNSHNVIGNRSFSTDPTIVSNVGNLCISLYKKNKIATVIKHIPGHGLTKSDSHYNLPVIKAKKTELINKDLLRMLDLNKSEIFILMCLAIPTLFFGFYPEPLLNTINISINNLIDTYNYKISLAK